LLYRAVLDRTRPGTETVWLMEARSGVRFPAATIRDRLSPTGVRTPVAASRDLRKLGFASPDPAASGRVSRVDTYKSRSVPWPATIRVTG